LHKIEAELVPLADTIPAGELREGFDVAEPVSATTEQQTSTNNTSPQEATEKRKLGEEGEGEARKKRKLENREKEKEKRKRARTLNSEHTRRCGGKRRVLFKTRCWCTNTAAPQKATKKRRLEKEQEREARKEQKRGTRTPSQEEYPNYFSGCCVS